MLNKYRIASYTIVLGLTVVLFLPVIGCAQSEGNKLTSKVQNKKIPGQQDSQITKNVKLQPQFNFSRQNAALNTAIKGLQKELSTTKTALVKARTAQVLKDKQINKLNQNIKSLQTAQTELTKVKKTQVEKDKKINGLNIAIKNMLATVKKKDTELATLNKAIKNLQTVVKKKDAELVELDTELAEMETELVSLDKEVVTADTKLVAMKTAINCYRKALSTWDDLHRKEGITEQILLTIAVELRRTIVSCPGI